MYNRLPCAGLIAVQPCHGPHTADVLGSQRYDFLPKQALSDPLSLIGAAGAFSCAGNHHCH
ncbi:hypothetical protein GCM10010971_16280 [Silvimonas amylolytica]|uniref:Uncharacterized protein n=1 Tax=Silvimonas amylolytica TaxID=449663 RepID=A0ABQ2PKP4_9NEIS|nr:hypothetical protein GCM10010971_16280 [Silvimonas amylolytica]